MHGSLVYIGDAQSNADKDVTLLLNAPADATLVWAPVSTQHSIEITGVDNISIMIYMRIYISMC